MTKGIRNKKVNKEEVATVELDEPKESKTFSSAAPSSPSTLPTTNKKVKTLRCKDQFPLNGARTATFFSEDPRLAKETVAMFNEQTGFITITQKDKSTVIISPSTWTFIELAD